MLSFQYLFCEGTQVGIPFLAESARQRLLQKLIHPDILSPALPHGIAAHVPTMIVKPDETIGKLLFAYRIERATDRLAEARLALSVCPFESAETALAIVAGEDTVLAVDRCSPDSLPVQLSRPSAQAHRHRPLRSRCPCTCRSRSRKTPL